MPLPRYKAIFRPDSAVGELGIYALEVAPRSTAGGRVRGDESAVVAESLL